MDRPLSYADILKKTVQAIKLYPVCDQDSGHYWTPNLSIRLWGVL